MNAITSCIQQNIEKRDTRDQRKSRPVDVDFVLYEVMLGGNSEWTIETPGNS